MSNQVVGLLLRVGENYGLSATASRHNQVLFESGKLSKRTGKTHKSTVPYLNI